MPNVLQKPAKINVEKEDELEDFLKSRKDWEKELAAEAKSGKVTVEKPTAKPKKKVFGDFGALLNKPIIDDFVDEDDDDIVCFPF